jgi:predicted MFS family arabinose efflux permease
MTGGAVGQWRPVVSGLCATLIGIGLARFAYTPLLPALIEAGWFEPSEAGYLGAANLVGYLAGALLARWTARHFAPAQALRATMLAATVAFFACAFPNSFAWFLFWRFVAGYAGGVLMALAAPAAIAGVPPARRGLASGVVITGVGLGIALSGTLVPLLLREGLTAAWLGLGLLALLLTAAAWNGWTPRAATQTGGGGAAPALAAPGNLRWVLYALCAVYGLNAAGAVPHMIFLVDYVARGLALGIDIGALYWVIFGVGALVGPTIAGRLADRIGFAAALRLAVAVQAAAVLIPVLTDAAAALAVSTLIVGVIVLGVVPLVLGRVHEVVPHDPDAQRAAWSLATVAFALGQAGAGYGFSLLYSYSGYALLFEFAAGACLVALAIDLAAPRPAGVTAPATRGNAGD